MSNETQVTVISATDDWYYVSYDDTYGYVSCDYIDLSIETSDSSDETQTGVVTASTLNVRSGSSTSYSVVGKIYSGDEVTIQSSENGWYYITSGSVTGYVSSDYISLSDTTDDEDDSGSSVSETITITIGTVTAGTLNVRSGPSTSYSVAGQLSSGAAVSITSDEEDGWYAISYDGETCYVSSEYITLTTYTYEYSSEEANELIEYALSFLGCEYVYGTSGPDSFDCSGFTSYVFSYFGYSLSRTSSAQSSNGIEVSFEDLQPGDLVFFSKYSGGSVTHVGIYIGNGQFIHASSTGDTVKISSFEDDTTSYSYYLNHFACACRILGVSS